MLFLTFGKKGYVIALGFMMGVLLLSNVTSTAGTQNFVKERKDVDLNYESRGAGNPVMLLHGFGASIYTWRYLVEPLSRQNQLIMIDLKGFGKSPKPHDNHYGVYDQADLIFKFIVEHKLTNLTLIGHSFGGGVALVTALKLIRERPDCLKQLVLIDAAAYKQDLPGFIEILKTPILGRLALSLVSNKRKVRMILKKSYYDDSKISDEQITAYAAPLGSEGARYALTRTARSIVPSDIQQLAARYKEITVPALILWGRQDKVVPLQIGQRLKLDIPDSTLVILENCGHIPHEEKPEESIAAISAFLKAHSTRAR